MQLDPKMQLAFVSTIGQFVPLSKEFQNALSLRASDKMSFAMKLDNIVTDLENAVGAGTITSQPTVLTSS